MALRIVANRPDPAIVTLPWSTCLEDWTDEHVVPLPRGLSRHVVRIVRLGQRVYAVKETTEDLAFREYRLLRDLQRLGLPAVIAQGVVTGRVDEDGEELPAALLTQHLQFSLPYRSLFQHGLTADNLPSLIDALVVLLVRLHLADFYWGDVSLSNVLFRRSAGGFAAYLVDAETGELRPELSRGMRDYDVTVGCENVFAELLDLQASETLDGEVRAHEIVDLIQERYDALWAELTGEEEFAAGEMWRIEQRIEHLNDLGFDVEEIDIVTDFDGDTVQIQPKVVELGHHQRELQGLTGMQRRGRPGATTAQRPGGVHRLPRPRRGGPAAGRQPLADRDLRADHRAGAARRARQARAGRDLPRDPGPPLAALRARRPRGGHLRDRSRLHRQRAHSPARRGGRRTAGVAGCVPVGTGARIRRDRARQTEAVRGTTRPPSRGAARPLPLRLRRALTRGSNARASARQTRLRWRRWQARGRSQRST